MSYCEYIKELKEDSPHIHYHNHVYGFPLDDDNELFARLIFELNQAGLSWLTILNKEKYFRAAFDDFDIHKVANYGDKDIERLLSDPGIIRNKLKINAAIHNAQIIQGLIKSHGSFKNWINANHPLSKDEWVKLFKKEGFKFVGGEIINEFMMSTGYLPGAHDENCPVYKEILRYDPMFLKS